MAAWKMSREVTAAAADADDCSFRAAGGRDDDDAIVDRVAHIAQGCQPRDLLNAALWGCGPVEAIIVISAFAIKSPNHEANKSGKANANATVTTDNMTTFKHWV